jgi:hypothetical protein
LIIALEQSADFTFWVLEQQMYTVRFETGR